MIGKPRFIKLIRVGFTDKILNFCAYLVLWIREAVSLQHVTFLQHPAAKSHAAQDYFLAILVNNLFALGVQVLGVDHACGDDHQSTNESSKPESSV